LYADILGGRIGGDRLRRGLERIGGEGKLGGNLLAPPPPAAGGAAAAPTFINPGRRAPPPRFHPPRPRRRPALNYFQTAAVLAADGVLDEAALFRVATDLVVRAGYTARRLENSLDDLVRRGHLSVASATALARQLRARSLLEAPPRVGRWRTMLG